MNVESIKKATKSVWGASPAGWTYADGHQKGTQQFFEAVLQKRFTLECDWMYDIVQFERFKGKKVLEIGSGAGYDAYQFCKQGATYTGIDITPDNPIIARKHLAYFGYDAQFLEMDVEELSLSEKYDYVFSFGVLHHTPNMQKALKNIYNVLEDKGEAQIIVYYKYSIFYMFTSVLFNWVARLKFLKTSLKDHRSGIEFTTSSAKPLVNVYGKREFHSLCKAAGFKILKTDIRKLVHEDLPSIPLIRRLYRFIPQSWLNIASKRFGWYLSVRMVKN